MLSYLIQFIVFSFFGWIIDSTYSSITEKRIVFSGYFTGIPLCPLYGFGGIVLLDSFKLLAGNPAWVIISITTALVIVVEYIGGYFSEHILGEKLWDYSNEFGNIHGYISVYHSFLWLLLVGLIYVIAANWIEYAASALHAFLPTSRELDVLLLFAFVSIGASLALHNKRYRLQKKHSARVS